MRRRWGIRTWLLKDRLKTGEGTEFRLESTEFDARIPDHIFNKASLRR